MIQAVIGLGFGDEGKGTAVDYLARRMDHPLVIRNTSGPQAAHSVVLPDGREHVFAQIGSGALAGARTLYQAPVCAPIAAVEEAKHLKKLGIDDIFDRVTFSSESLITTPYHQAANRLREMARGKDRHGSCGFGIHETISDAETYGMFLTVGELVSAFRDGNVGRLIDKLNDIRQLKLDSLSSLDLPGFKHVDEYFILTNRSARKDFQNWLMEKYQEFVTRFTIEDPEGIEQVLRQYRNFIYESAQGLLLDPDYGFFPYVTRLSPLAAIPQIKNHATQIGQEPEYIFCVRTYASRHGAGPFPSETKKVKGHDPHNAPNESQGVMRYGWQDLPLLKYALRVAEWHHQINHLNSKLFVTHADILSRGKMVIDYHNTNPTEENEDHLIRLRESFVNVASGKEEVDKFFSQLKPELKEFDNIPMDLVAELGRSIKYCSFGPTYLDKL